MPTTVIAGPLEASLGGQGRAVAGLDVVRLE
jgi:hypothetical protein